MLPHFRTYQIYSFTAQSHVTAHQRDSQAVKSVNVNHPRALSSMQNFQTAISWSFLNRFTSDFLTK